MTVEFVDTLPGRTVGRRHELTEFADELRKNPNKWGKYPRAHSNPKSAYSCASAINHDKFNALKGPEFEATARKQSGTVSVYVRYTGQKTAAAATPEPVVAAEEPTVSYSYPGEQQPAESNAEYSTT